MSHTVFISYSQKDKDTAGTVLNFLESAGIECWMAPRNIGSGMEWVASISQAIAESRVMVLIVSANSNLSDHVLREVLEAVNEEVVIVPLVIEDVPMSRSLNFLLGIKQLIEAWVPPIETHLMQLAADLRIIIESLPSDSAHPGPTPGIDEIMDEAERSLSRHDPVNALECLKRVGRSADSRQDVRKRVLTALAVVGGRSFNCLSKKEITRIESELIPVVNDLEYSILPLALLAALEIDYYKYHGQKGPSGIRAGETRGHVQQRGFSSEESSLLRLINLSDRAAEFLNLGAGNVR